MQLYLNFERLLAPPEIENFRELIRRRGQREPLQHIVGSTSFCGFEIAVNRHVLIPRPETELLAERGWTFLNQRSAGEQPPVALDFGTGSGCLAIALAGKSPASEVHALDLSSEALALARENADRHSLSNRIYFFHGNGFAALPERSQFDLIISNPPYIPTAEIPTLQPEVREHFDPSTALDGGPEGLSFYRRLAAEAAPFLKPGGLLMLEFGDGQAGAIEEILRQQKWVVEAVEPDYNQKQRLVIARR